MPTYRLGESYLDTNPLQIKDFKLKQIGRFYSQGGNVVAVHRHKDLFELTIITGGTGTITTNGVPTAVKRGDVYLSFPFDLHSITSSMDDPLQFDFFAFETSGTIYEDDFSKIFNRYSPAERLFTDERIATLIGHALVEFYNDFPFSQEVLYHIFNQILIFVIRDFQMIKPHSPSLNTSQPEMFCYQIMHYIDTHIYSIKNLDEIATTLNYNYSYLFALFKKTTGHTISSYHQQKKLETACVLLEEGSLNVTQIAETLNYSSPYAFSRAFKAIYHCSPKQYTKQKSKPTV